jgi:uncharacterized membrane protein
MARLEEAVNRMAFALIVAAFVIGLSLLLQHTELPEWFVWVARVGVAGAVVMGSWFFVSALMAHYSRRRRQ